MKLINLQDIISEIDVYDNNDNKYLFHVWNGENSYPTKFEQYFDWEVVYIYLRNDALCCDIKE